MKPSSARPWLRDLLRQLASLAVADARRMTLHHDAAVHALRVRMKKLRAVLDLVADDPTHDGLAPLVDRARLIKDGIAGARDTLVAERVAARIAHGPLPMAPIIHAPTWKPERVLEETAILQLAVRGMKLPEITWNDVARRFANGYCRARKAMAHCAHSHDAEDFHQWRKHVKRHYFQSLALYRHQVKLKRVRAAARLGSKLGREHDLALVEARLDHCKQAQPWLKRIALRRRKLHRRLVEVGKRVFALSPRRFAKRVAAFAH